MIAYDHGLRHDLTIAPHPHYEGRLLVTCSAGCNLGTSANCDGQAEAKRRVRLHEIATAPLGPEGPSLP